MPEYFVAITADRGALDELPIDTRLRLADAGFREERRYRYEAIDEPAAAGDALAIVGPDFTVSTQAL
jgi:hypothetical protein